MPADLGNALGAGDQADDQWPGHRLELLGCRDVRHDRDIGGLDAAIGEIDAGRGLRRAADAGQDHIGLIEIIRMLTIIMDHGEVERIDAAEIFGIERMLAGKLRPRLGIEILCKACNHRIEDGYAGNGELGASLLELRPKIGIDQGEENDARLGFDLGQTRGQAVLACAPAHRYARPADSRHNRPSRRGPRCSASRRSHPRSDACGKIAERTRV